MVILLLFVRKTKRKHHIKTKRGVAMKKVFIFSIKVAKNLAKNGFRIIDITENQKDKDKIVFVFQNTDEIREYLNENFNIQITF